MLGHSPRPETKTAQCIAVRRVREVIAQQRAQPVAVAPDLPEPWCGVDARLVGGGGRLASRAVGKGRRPQRPVNVAIIIINIVPPTSTASHYLIYHIHQLTVAHHHSWTWSSSSSKYIIIYDRYITTHHIPTHTNNHTSSASSSSSSSP